LTGVTGPTGQTGHTGPTGPTGAAIFDLTKTTGTATSGGGTITGDILANISIGYIFALYVKATGNTIDSDIEFFADAARTDRIYYAQNKNCYTTAHVDRTPWACFTFDNELESKKIYYKITNNGLNDSTYDIEMYGQGQ
jgi:hypothetical protein